MIWSLSETLKFIEPYIPYHLIPPPTFSHLQTMAKLLPDALSAYYLECRLGANATQVDFSACVTAAKGGHEVLVEARTGAALPDTLLRNPLWGRVYEFLKEWANPTSLLHGQVPFIWLEFDHLDELPPLLLPCINFCLDPEYLHRHTRSNHSVYHPNTQKFQPFIDLAFERLLGHAIPPRTKQNMAICFELLPPGGQIIYMAAMLPRQPVALKMNGLIPSSCLLEYLTQIGWTGSIAAMEKIVNTFCTSMDELRIGLTVSDKISSRLDIEFFSNTSALPPSDSQRQFLLDHLVEKRLCTPEKRDALLSWSGFSTETFNHQSWPTRLNRSWYAKLVYQADGRLEAKGYLGFAPTLFSLFSLA